MKSKLIILTSFILLMIFQAYAQQKSTSSSEFKLNLSQAMAIPRDRKYTDIVWNWLVSNIQPKDQKLSETLIKEKYGFAKDEIGIALLDLNSDKMPDIISFPGNLYCGSGGCSLVLFLSPQYKANELNVGVFPDSQVGIRTDVSSKYKSLLLPNKTKCSFDNLEKSYRCR